MKRKGNVSNDFTETADLDTSGSFLMINHETVGKLSEKLLSVTQTSLEV